MGSILDRVLDFMNEHLGGKYSQSNRYGDNTFDCSSFVYRAFEAAGVSLVHRDTGGKADTSREEVYARDFELISPDSYARIGRGRASVDNAQSGDLIFYGFKGSGISHVATVNRAGGIIHARNAQKGVCTDPISYGASSVCAVLRYKDSIVGGGGTEKNAITSLSVKSISGNAPTPVIPALLNFSVSAPMGNVELVIQHGQKIYIVDAEDSIKWDTERKDTPGKFTFKIPPRCGAEIMLGDAVRMRYFGAPVFFGFVFSVKEGQSGDIDVTAYDQLRYLKNKDTYVYNDKTASELLRMIADDYYMNIGLIDDTGYRIESKVEDNATLFDVIGNALDATLQNDKKMYVMYDDFGRLNLRDIETMKVPILIERKVAEDFSYTATIDSDVYNKIKLTHDNEDAGVREVYIAQDGANINQWGVLQYYENMKDVANAAAKADALLALYNMPKRTLSVPNVLGDIRVRAGASVIVQLELNDIKIQNFMMCEKVSHKFEKGYHTMDLTLRGGDFVV